LKIEDLPNLLRKVRGMIAEELKNWKWIIDNW
jgi:hypothetical protein